MPGWLDVLIFLAIVGHFLFARFAAGNLQDEYRRTLPADTYNNAGEWLPVYRNSEFGAFVWLVIIPILGEVMWLYLRPKFRKWAEEARRGDDH